MGVVACNNLFPATSFTWCSSCVFICVCLQMSVLAIQRPEESIVSPVIGVTGFVSHHVGAMDQTLVLWKNRVLLTSEAPLQLLGGLCF